MKVLVLLFFALVYTTCRAVPPTYDLKVDMRDGKSLAVDVYVPDTTKQWPVILIQTPYSRLGFRFGLPFVGNKLSTSEYAFVVADWRCFWGSTAACVGQPKRGEDGKDLVDWIAQQSWSNGKVGTWGPSALGGIQMLTAKEKPAALVCAVPQVASPIYSYEHYFPGGVARKEYIEQLDALGFGLGKLLYANPVHNIVWQVTEAGGDYPEDIEIPMLLEGGWYDHNVQEMVDYYNALATRSHTSVQDKHKILIGPWAHGGKGKSHVGAEEQGELDYPEAAGMSDSLALQFFDYYLLGENNGWEQNGKFMYMQMGENVWESTSSWPPVKDTLKFYLGSAYQLSLIASSDSSISYDYDPRDPSPTIGGATLRNDLKQGPYDQADSVESRDDILVFSTEILNDDVVVTGRPKVVLTVSSDMTDTDFAVRFTDVYPDGRSILLSDGIQRMRFRNGYTKNDTSQIVPSQEYQIVIELPSIANTFLAGHQIRLSVSSSNYPRYDINPNTGGGLYQPGDTLVAKNTLGVGQGSYLELLVNQEPQWVNNIAKAALLSAFPNPFSSQTTIQLPDYNSSFNYKVYDQLGRAVRKGKDLTGYQFTIPGEELDPGIYSIVVYSSGISVAKAMVMRQ